MHSLVGSGSPGLIDGTENDGNGSARRRIFRLDEPGFSPLGEEGNPARSRWHMLEGTDHLATKGDEAP